jgi:hypothetical protein
MRVATGLRNDRRPVLDHARDPGEVERQPGRGDNCAGDCGGGTPADRERDKVVEQHAQPQASPVVERRWDADDLGSARGVSVWLVIDSPLVE